MKHACLQLECSTEFSPFSVQNEHDMFSLGKESQCSTSNDLYSCFWISLAVVFQLILVRRQFVLKVEQIRRVFRQFSGLVDIPHLDHVGSVDKPAAAAAAHVRHVVVIPGGLEVFSDKT